MEPVEIVFDIFPALVRLPSGTVIDRARAILADGVFTVWVDGSQGPQARYAREMILSLEGSSGAGFAVQVEDGIVTVERSSNCGCGSVLNSFNPWPNRARKLVALT